MKVIACIAAITALAQADAFCRDAQVRLKVPLSRTWRFSRGELAGAEEPGFDDGAWEKVTIPHTYNPDLTKLTGYYKGSAWYRSVLPVTPNMKGKRLFLRFEGALTTAEVYLNGKRVGMHAGGYSAFAFEVTPHVKWRGRNLLAVCVNNAHDKRYIPTRDGLFKRFGGIYRPAALIVTDQVCITPLDYASPGVYVRQDNVTDRRAEVSVTTMLSSGPARAEGVELVTTIYDADGRRVEARKTSVQVSPGKDTPVTQKFTISNPRLWNARKDPYMYRVTVQVRHGGQVVDEVSQSMGLRYFRVDAAKGFFLNGEYLDLHGVCRHQEWEHVGSALTDEHHESDIKDILEVGANAVRLAHYQQADTMYSLCDQYGIIVWAEIPLVHTPSKPFDNVRQQLTELIRQNYNHPSICFWGMYNESDVNTDQVKDLHNLAKAEDPTRLTTAATNRGLQPKHRATDLICWNKYYLWYSKSNRLGPWADGQRKKGSSQSFVI